MHDCLRISEILHLICGFLTSWDVVDRWTLASLARTCQLFSSPALDVLWHDLPSFKPLLDVFPITASSVDDMQWLTFRKYAVRVKIVHGVEEDVLLEAKEEFLSAVQHCPPAYLPLLPNLTELEWLEWDAYDFVFSVLRYFASSTVTTITFRLQYWVACPSAEWDAFMDLLRACPNVTSFSITPSRQWDHNPSQEIGRIVTQWPRLKTLRACPLPQSVMDQLFSRQTFEALGIICDKSPPIYNGRIPDSVRELTLSTEPLICTHPHFLETAYASPTKFSLFINEGGLRKEDQGAAMDMCYLLPRHLDTSHLLSLTIQPNFCTFRIPLGPLVSMIVEFTALRELDLDHLSTVQMTNKEFACMARSLPHLRSLKLGTRVVDPYIRVWPVASVEAVIAVLTFCEHLETLCIMFNGRTPPPAPLGELTSQGWGVSNRHITELRVGQSPINIDSLRACLKSIMPYLVLVASFGGRWNM